jgi:DNA-binding GntR family transcriptional regulator
MTQGEAAYNNIRDRIISGELPPGYLLKEVALAEHLNLSRTPIREALRRLSESGLVEIQPNKGARVVGWSESQMAETYEIRAILESHAAQLAASAISDEELDLLEGLVEDMERVVASEDEDDILELANINQLFHHTVLEASGNKQLIGLVTSVSQVAMLVRDRAQLGIEFRKQTNHQHRDILAALRTGDGAWAKVAMESHILAALNAAKVGPSGHRPRPQTLRETGHNSTHVQAEGDSSGR